MGCFVHDEIFVRLQAETNVNIGSYCSITNIYTAHIFEDKNGSVDLLWTIL